MKIIKQGTIPTHQVKCIQCGSVIEYNNTEEKSIFTKDMAFYGDCTDWSVKCPICEMNTPTRSLTDDGYYDWRIK